MLGSSSAIFRNCCMIDWGLIVRFLRNWEVLSWPSFLHDVFQPHSIMTGSCCCSSIRGVTLCLPWFFLSSLLGWLHCSWFCACTYCRVLLLFGRSTWVPSSYCYAHGSPQESWALLVHLVRCLHGLIVCRAVSIPAWIRGAGTGHRPLGPPCKPPPPCCTRKLPQTPAAQGLLPRGA
jgi:hypothetical protein